MKNSYSLLINSINSEENYTNFFQAYKARALIYQSASLSDNLEKKFSLLVLLNDLFKQGDIEDAFLRRIIFNIVKYR